MRRFALLALLLFSMGAFGAPAPIPSADELLERSLQYHDPRGVWSSRPIEFDVEVRLAPKLAELRGYETRTDRIRIDNSSGEFRYISKKGEDRIKITSENGTLRAWLNGSTEIGADEQEHHRLSPENLPSWRNYMIYMYGIPMKLRDPGSRLDPQIKRTELAGQEVFALRVTYDPEVGKDVWYFYLDSKTSALVGCRFYHDEAQNDGEYLVFEGEVQGPKGLRLPKIRRWYMNKDDEYIAVDEISSIK